ncbi:MAG: hypothetical protein A2Y40_02895 [Candidatus Margulisbacteria bacterium GWF2_35_9]|nr:MAG: hypothetical protein A2Y40_02895 [Candidatus Margulisbacteria bacterium GWF2_35_9]
MIKKLFGKPPINPFLFFTGKFSGYFIWVLVFRHFIQSGALLEFSPINTVAFILFVIGLTLIVISLLNLGKSVSLGVPSEKTKLKTYGLYKFSRNPMYLGFNLFTISGMLLTLNPLIIAMGIFSIFTYHQIIYGEEQFLRTRFGYDYVKYSKKVRRYF